jgi:(E)-4-hydroxy-3-methylbut-2-enyl-diphosphate synthase
MKRKETKKVYVGGVAIGGCSPIAVQSMTNTKTHDWKSTVSQIKRLEELGCEIIRVAVPDQKDIEQLSRIKKEINIPLIADIHFGHEMALLAIKAGADCIRINPGNVGGKDGLRMIAKAARERQMPIRIGVNSGSLQKSILEKYGRPTPEAIVESAILHVKFLEDHDFDLIKVSLKSSDVLDTIKSYRMFSEQSYYPLHLGVTEAGLPLDAAVKSSLGIGTLLMEGIGDTFRVSVTGAPEIEMEIAFTMLRSLGIRKQGVNFISCPTCGRTEIDLISLAEKIHARLKKIKSSLSVAVMGCPVNGPGEAKEADIGIAWGRKGKGALFKKGKIIKTGISEDKLESVLLGEIEEMTGERVL